MILTDLTGERYRGRDGKSLKTVGEFCLQDDSNKTKRFVFTAERDDSTGRWLVGKHLILDKKTKIPLSKLVPNKDFGMVVSALEDILTERLKRQYVIECNLEIGDGEKESFLRSVGERIDIKGSLTVKNKGNLTLVRSDMDVSKNTIKKTD